MLFYYCKQLLKIINCFGVCLNRKRRRFNLNLHLYTAENRTRTDDPFITSEVLYQLSYFGIGFIATSYIISPFLRNFNCFLFFFLHMHSQLIIWNLNSFFIKCQFYLFKKFPSCIPVFFHLHISTDS